MNKYDYNNLTPFKWFVLENFPFIEADFDALTNWQLFCKLGKEMNKIINTMNNLGQGMEDFSQELINSFNEFTTEINTTVEDYISRFNQLKDFVDNYFNNLDVQEEINNKLDDMVEQGILQEIIISYLQVQGILAYNNVQNMKEATNLKNGSFAQTFGFYEKNDGGASKYKIRELQENETADEITLITLNNNYVAELIKSTQMSIKQFGAKGNNSNDDTQFFIKAIQFCSSNKIELIIPEGTFLLNTITNKTTDYSYNYLIELLDNTCIKGCGRNSIIKTTLTDNYTAIFFSDINISNITIENLTIEQNYASGNNMNLSNRSNIKCACVLYGQASNVLINKIFFKNCCGADVISFNNENSANIQVKNNEFDYHYVRNISYYDRSIIYMECHDYLVENNILKGNFETLGGIECHGYNGICTKNYITKCEIGIHIAPRYSKEIKSANIIVTNNIEKENAIGIELWYNTKPNNDIGCSGITIADNIIKTYGYIYAQNFFKGSGLVPPSYVAGIMPAPTADNKNFSDINIDNNIISLKDYSDYISYTNKNTLYLFTGISVLGRSDMKNLHITNNTIEGFASYGIAFGDIRSSATPYSHTSNVEVTGNTIVNCGYGAFAENSFKANIFIGLGIMENVIIRNNILSKTDSEYNLPYAIYNNGGVGTEKTNVYCDNNIIKSVGSSTEEAVINRSGYNTLIMNKGNTANRPTTAVQGNQYYDTTINKPIWFNGTNWIDASGNTV